MSEIENQRGKILENFITMNNLFVCNIGNKFIYDCAIGKSIIDKTIVSTVLVDRIRNWSVHDEKSLSDHKLVSFNLSFDKPKARTIRNFKNANWIYFKSILSKKQWSNPPKTWSKETIEIEATKPQDDINDALDKICPVKEKTTKSQPPRWWNTTQP